MEKTEKLTLNHIIAMRTLFNQQNIPDVPLPLEITIKQLQSLLEEMERMGIQQEHKKLFRSIGIEVVADE